MVLDDPSEMVVLPLPQIGHHSRAENRQSKVFVRNCQKAKQMGVGGQNASVVEIDFSS